MANSSTGSGISLSNTVYSDIAPVLPLPLLPVFCGALDQDLRLFDDKERRRSERSRTSNRQTDGLGHAGKIADLLHNVDVSYLDLRADASPQPSGFVGNLDLYNEVLRCNSEAFSLNNAGPTKNTAQRRKTSSNPLEAIPSVQLPEPDTIEIHDNQHDHVTVDITASSRKSKVKKKGRESTGLSSGPDASEDQGAVAAGFSEMLEDFCGRAEEFTDEGVKFKLLSAADLRVVQNEITSIRAKKALPLVPVDILMRLLRVLDHQIHQAMGLSVDDCEQTDTDVVSSIFCALESIHAALALMAYNGMPKQLYKEEIIERIVDFSRHQVMGVMLGCDPTFRALHKPTEIGIPEADEDDDEDDEDFVSPSKKKKSTRGMKPRKSTSSRVSSAVSGMLQKLCVILGFLKELCIIERLPDSCILQLIKTCFTTFLVENIQLLQLKSISLISGIFYAYAQHRSHIMDETLHIILKLPSSKKMPRTYHLPDEEKRQIQLITALLIQIVHCSSNLPDILRETSDSPSLEVSIDASYPTKSIESVTDACCLFWSRVLQRLANTKNQEAAEWKSTIENFVIDLLTTLNLPEYPASAPLLEVLCVLLLQNAGLKSKDVSVRSMAIDLLGTIAARLKQDVVSCREEKLWIVKELRSSGDVSDPNLPKDACAVCLENTRVEKSLVQCHGCERLFHLECTGFDPGYDVPNRGFHCQLCFSKKQLDILKSHCEAQSKDGLKKSKKTPQVTDAITNMEIVQQLLLNYLHDAATVEDLHLFTRWFYLCFWYKDDPNAQQKFMYYVARLKSKAIVRDSVSLSSLVTRDAAKKITLALGQKSSFSRGFDKILHVLLASLRENSPIIRSKALRAVSFVVEADPEVLGDKLVQTAVEGRFCDSAISVREAALELVGRHILSYPDVGLKYFEKLAERIKDTGVSVRKRAVKIIREMCNSNSNFTEFTTACVEIISRINDEESSVQDLVCKTFYEFWFEEPSGSQHQSFEDGSSVPLEVAKKTEQIVQVLRRMTSLQPLVTVIKRNLTLDFFSQSAKALGINPVALASVRRRCELMCKCLLEKILQVSEMNTGEGEVHMLPYMRLLHAFCVVDPSICAPASDPAQFVVTLQPYLKSQADNRVAAQLLESIIFVIDSVLPLLRKLPQGVAEELELDLKHMIVRHSFLTVVHACIKCLCSVTKVAGKGSTIVEHLIQLFFKRLEALGFSNKQNFQQVGRSLFCLGLLIRYSSSLLYTYGSSNNFHIASSLNLFKKYLQAEDFIIKVRSLQALGYVFIAHPECMLEKDVGKILEATLSSSTDTRLKMQSLQNMYEYLVDAESQMGTYENEVAVRGTSVPVAAGAGDTNICGGIVQLYWSRILERCLDVNELVRQSALQIVEIVLRQGLVHPITCVPFLIALETDHEEANSKLAHHLLMNMNEKYPSFFESRLGDGLQMSFMFIQAMSQGGSQNSKIQSKVDHARHGLSRIYKLIRGNRISRNKFMASVVRKFDTINRSDSAVPFLMYCAEILALLPFTSPDEPLYLIYIINRIIQVRAGTVEANMKGFLQHLQAGSQKTNENESIQMETTQPVECEPEAMVTDATVPDGLEGNHVHEDNGLENSYVDPNVASLNPHCICDTDLQMIRVECLAAGALQLLLRLKRHLKVVYDLNDARCQEYSPTEPPKPGEGFSRQNLQFNVNEYNIDPPENYEDFVRRYQDFKNVLKEDTVDYAVYTANIKRKRPPAAPKKIKKSTPVRVTSRARDDDDDEDDDDEDWDDGGGSEMRNNNNNSVRRSSSRLRQQY